jgi:hypothetical protein
MVANAVLVVHQTKEFLDWEHWEQQQYEQTYEDPCTRPLTTNVVRFLDHIKLQDVGKSLDEKSAMPAHLLRDNSIIGFFRRGDNYFRQAVHADVWIDS